jgi:DNA mismatch repair protein MutS2
MVHNLKNNTLLLLDYPQIISEVSKLTTFYASREKAANMIPKYVEKEVTRLQIETEEARTLIDLEGIINLRDIKDISEEVKRASLGSTLDGIQLIDISNTVNSLLTLKNKILDHENKILVLSDISRNIPDLSFLNYMINSKIDHNGLVKDSANPYLKQLRSRLRESYNRVIDELKIYINKDSSHEAIQDDIISIRNDRLVIQVKSNLRTQKPGIVHGASNTGMTLFIEPYSTVELCNMWRELVLEEERTVLLILHDLTEQVGVIATDILIGVENASEIDFIMARARYSELLKGFRNRNHEIVTTVQSSKLILNNARHPLLADDSVPLSLNMDKSWSLLVITGPNAGGKTVALKTIGLLAAMNQVGIQVPVDDGSLLPIFDGIYADIGDQQSIENAASTFSSHIKNITNIWKVATSKSLVLLDEIGGSTDPEEGSAIAQAILEKFSHAGIVTIATTHHKSVAAMAEESNHMRNASFILDSTTLKPTYSMIFGMSGNSSAITVAEKLGLPDEMLKSAKQKLSPQSMVIDKWLNNMNAKTTEIQNTRNEIDINNDMIKNHRQTIESQIQYLIENTDQILQSTHNTAKKQYETINSLLDQAKAILSWAQYSDEPKQHIEKSLQEISDLKDVIPTSLLHLYRNKNSSSLDIDVGSEVIIKDLDVIGTITSYDKTQNKVDMKVGNITLNIEAHRVSATNSIPLEKVPVKYSYNFKQTFDLNSFELDIRGLRGDEAKIRIDAFIDKSLENELQQIRIIHGKGTGILRNIVRETLSNHFIVREFKPEIDGVGGHGSTMVYLR